MTYCVHGELSGAYLGMLMEPPPEFSQAEDAALELVMKTGVHDMMLREVGYRGTPMISVDLLLDDEEAVLEAIEGADARVFRKDLYTCLELI